MDLVKPSEFADYCLKKLNLYNEALIAANETVLMEIKPSIDSFHAASSIDKFYQKLLADYLQKLREYRKTGLYIQKERELIVDAKPNYNDNQLKKAAYCSLLSDTFTNLENLFYNIRELIAMCREIYCKNYIVMPEEL